MFRKRPEEGVNERAKHKHVATSEQASMSSPQQQHQPQAALRTSPPIPLPSPTPAKVTKSAYTNPLANSNQASPVPRRMTRWIIMAVVHHERVLLLDEH